MRQAHNMTPTASSRALPTGKRGSACFALNRSTLTESAHFCFRGQARAASWRELGRECMHVHWPSCKSLHVFSRHVRSSRCAGRAPQHVPDVCDGNDRLRHQVHEGVRQTGLQGDRGLGFRA